MKIVILIICFMCFASFTVQAQKYKHKSEAEIAAMTPTQRVDEYVDEWVHHRYDVLDKQIQLIRKYIRINGVKALPRIIEIIDEYDPTRGSGIRKSKAERFDGAWLLLGDIDNHVIRLTSFEEGNRAISALEKSIERMRKAGYDQPDQDGWDRHGRFESVEDEVKEFNGINLQDIAIKDTLRFVYKINISDAELLDYVQFLTARYPDYPSWSEGKLTKDESKIGPGGYPVQIILLEQPKRYYKAYLEFKKTK